MQHLAPASVAGALALAQLALPPSGVSFPRADASDPAKVLAEIKRSFETFKTEHTQALAGKADVVVDEKVERINTAISDMQATLDGLAIKIAAAQTSGADVNEIPRDPAYAKLFASYFRSGDGEREVKAQQFLGPRAAMEKGAASKGGLVAPIEWDRSITDKLVIVSPVRSIATVQPIGGTAFSKLYNLRGTASGWVTEKQARPETSGPNVAEQTFYTHELYANPAATQELLDDALVDIEAWLASECETEFALQEGVAFVAGDGVSQPKGFLTYTNPASHPLGAVAEVKTGAAADITSDGFIEIIHDLPSERTANARFAMNRKTQGKVRKLKDGQGRYLWEPSTQVGDPATLNGYPITELAAMPDVAANSIPIVFGDFSGYLVVDRMGIRVLRDPYTNKPFVQFYTTKRVGGGMLDPSKFRYHRVAA